MWLHVEWNEGDLLMTTFDPEPDDGPTVDEAQLLAEARGEDEAELPEIVIDLDLWRDEAGLGVCTGPHGEFARDYRIVALIERVREAEASLVELAPLKQGQTRALRDRENVEAEMDRRVTNLAARLAAAEARAEQAEDKLAFSQQTTTNVMNALAESGGETWEAREETENAEHRAEAAEAGVAALRDELDRLREVMTPAQKELDGIGITWQSRAKRLGEKYYALIHTCAAAEAERDRLTQAVTTLADKWEALRTFVYNSKWYAAHLRSLVSAGEQPGDEPLNVYEAERAMLGLSPAEDTEAGADLDAKSPVRQQDSPVAYPTDDDGMCPNCVTPWKCNGPHVPWPPQPSENERLAQVQRVFDQYRDRRMASVAGAEFYAAVGRALGDYEFTAGDVPADTTGGDA